MTFRTMLLGAIIAGGLLAAALQGQTYRSRIYSRPDVPSKENLRRLNLVVAWRNAVPMDNSRDAIIRADLDGKDLFILTRSGAIARLDAETGKSLWRNRITKPYTLSPYLAYNSRSVYVFGNGQAFGFDRETGSKKWEYQLRSGVSASPIADAQQIYVPTTDTQLRAFYLPYIGISKKRGGEGSSEGGSLVYGSREELAENRPVPVWEETTNAPLVFQPLQTSDSIFVIGSNGQAFGFSKVLRDGGSELYTFSTTGKIRVAPGQYGKIGYVGSEDATLYAINLNNGRLLWRHSAGTAITRKPIALDKDVFITSQREGLARIDRASGESGWKVPRGRAIVDSNFDADRFLAANDRLVYANDHSNRLLILDRKRGVRLSMLDTSAFRIPIVNEVTDRLYLAANDGLIVCLRDRDLPRPIRHRSLDRESSAAKQLEQLIVAPAGKPSPLRDVLNQLRDKYKLKFVPAERAFKEAGLANFQDRQVTAPAVDKKPLKEYLQRILSQANATYEVVEDTILLVPAKAAKGK